MTKINSMPLTDPIPIIIWVRINFCHYQTSINENLKMTKINSHSNYNWNRIGQGHRINFCQKKFWYIFHFQLWDIIFDFRKWTLSLLIQISIQYIKLYLRLNLHNTSLYRIGREKVTTAYHCCPILIFF